MINKNVAQPVIFHFSFDPLPESLYFPSKNIMRVLAISDIHVDHAANLEWVKHLSRWDYTEDALIVAGDISDRLSHLETTFELLKQRFAEVCFVPGNHELWIRNDGFSDSFQKFHAILNICQQHDVRTTPFLFGARSSHPVWIVPLFGWYLKPEDGPGSLFLPKPGEDPSLAMWADHYHVKWPAGITNSAAVRYFLRFNVENGFSSSGHPVITFSHFLPRQELIFPDNFDPVEAQNMTGSRNLISAGWRDAGNWMNNCGYWGPPATFTVTSTEIAIGKLTGLPIFPIVWGIRWNGRIMQIPSCLKLCGKHLKSSKCSGIRKVIAEKKPIVEEPGTLD